MQILISNVSNTTQIPLSTTPLLVLAVNLRRFFGVCWVSFFLIHQQISRNFYSIIIRISIKAQLPVVSSFAFSKAILKLIRRFFSSRCSGFLICRSLQARKEDEILTLIFFVPPIMSVPDIRTLFSLAKHISWISSAMFNDIAYFFPSTAPFRSNVSVRARCCKAVEIKVSEASF